MSCSRRIALLCSIVFVQHAMYHYYPSPYRPTIFGGEPRLVQDWMSSAFFDLRGGSIRHSFNCSKLKTSALCVYGPENIYALTKGVPTSVTDRDPDCYLNTVWQACPHAAPFGLVYVDGAVSMTEFLPTFIQNFNHGFFASLTVPIGHITVRNISFNDLSNRKNAGRNIDYARWQYTTNALPQHLAAYGVCAKPHTTRGIGDIQLLAGWGYNYEDMEVLDYVDFTITAGVNFPTGARAKPALPFSLPLGYNGHWGIPVIAYASLGAFDWLTIGMRGGAIWFFDTTMCLPMKTDFSQSGWIRLARGTARVHKRPIWHIDEYLKFDHIIENLSFVFGFGHDHALATSVYPCDQTTFCPAIVNSDQRLLSWSMDRFHWILEFDMATYQHPNLPRIAFTIDKSFAGKRVLDTALFGAYLGLDIEWQL